MDWGLRVPFGRACSGDSRNRPSGGCRHASSHLGAPEPPGHAADLLAEITARFRPASRTGLSTGIREVFLLCDGALLTGVREPFSSRPVRFNVLRTSPTVRPSPHGQTPGLLRPRRHSHPPRRHRDRLPDLRHLPGGRGLRQRPALLGLWLLQSPPCEAAADDGLLRADASAQHGNPARQRRGGQRPAGLRPLILGRLGQAHHRDRGRRHLRGSADEPRAGP